MPNVLIIHLQRIVFDFDTFQQKKVNDKLEFPTILDMKRYSFKEQSSGQASDAETQKLLDIADEDYEYRLVGVNIHRGVASSGHYWSMIHTKRGEHEPDPESSPQDWAKGIDSDWMKFDDDTVSFYSAANLP